MSMGFFDTVATDDVTLHGLEKWTCYLYENLGWMTLAYESNNNDKVSSYLISIKKLKLSIESRLKIITGEDAKIDLATLLSKVKHLYSVATNLFDKNKIRKSVCDKCALPIHNNNLSEPDEKNQLDKVNQLKGGNKSIKSVKSNKLIKPSKTSGSKTINVLKLSKNDNLDKVKKLSKKSSKKLSKNPSKKGSKIKDEPLIKKLSKKSSKKLSKKSSKENKSIFRKM